MKEHERRSALAHSLKLAWNILLRGRYDFVYDRMSISSRKMSIRKLINILKAGTKLGNRKLTPPNMPLHMQMELVNFCNLSCPVCPTGSRLLDRKRQILDTGLFQHVVDQVGPYLLTASLWGWAEPLLHPHLAEILRIIRKYPVATFLSTNGQNLNDDRVLKAIIDEPPTHLIVAVDGITEETNAMYRVGAKLSPILDGIRRLSAMKKRKGLEFPILQMRFIVMKHNQHELPELKDFAKNLGFDLLIARTLSIIDTEDSDATHREFVPDPSEFKAYDYTGNSRTRMHDYICQQPFWFPSLFADGTLVACEQDYNARHSLGKITPQTSFTDLWFSRQAARTRKMIRDDPEKINFCRNCPYRDRPTTDCSVQTLFMRSGLPHPTIVQEINAP